MYMHIYVLNRCVYLYLMYMHIHICIYLRDRLAKKRDREFEREQGGVNGRVWRESEIIHYNLK